MSWCYITQEQGAAIDRICREHYTGFKDNDCPTCPIRETCRMELPAGTSPEASWERTQIFETAMSEAAEAYNRQRGEAQ